MYKSGQDNAHVQQKSLEKVVVKYINRLTEDTNFATMYNECTLCNCGNRTEQFGTVESVDLISGKCFIDYISAHAAVTES